MKGKGCAALGRGSSQKEPHREGREEGREGVFLETGLSAQPRALSRPQLPCSPQPCPPSIFRCTEQSHPDWLGVGGWETRYPISTFQFCLLVLATGGGGVTGERKGDFRSILFLQMGAFKVCIFQASLIYPMSPLGGSAGLQGKMKACDIHHVTVPLAEKQV